MNRDSDAIALREELESLRAVFHASPDAVLITRLADGRFFDMNASALALTGYGRDELDGSSTVATQMWCSAEDRNQFVALLRAHGRCDEREWRFQRKNGEPFPALVSARVVEIRGEPHVVSVITDISARKAAEEQLREQEELYRSILDASPDDITITDLAGRLLIVSPAAHRIFGYPAGFDVGGLTIGDFIAPVDLPRARATIQSMYQGTYIGPNNYQGVRKDGSLLDIEVNSGFIRDAAGNPSKMVFVVRDVTERMLAERRIQELIQQLEQEKAYAQAIAMTDGLTGLANRRAFDRALQNEFSRFKRFGGVFSVLLLDIDHFKNFNDRYGHMAGDECLRKVGERLTTTVGRLPDVVARYGGEEFVAILPGTPGAGAEKVGRRMIDAVIGLGIAHEASDTASNLTISIGIATATGDITSHDDLLLLADKALYEAKAGGRNRLVVASVACCHREDGCRSPTA